MFDWFRQLTSQERRTFAACFGGWALDSMDVNIYGLVITSLKQQWGITNAEAGLLGTAALVVSAFGGWIVGLLADRVGRVRMLQLTILWFAVFTALSGLTQNFSQLLVVRGLQGLGFGGEWAAGAVLMGEIIRPEHRGKAVGGVQSGWAIGWAAAVLLQALLFSLLPAELAWRALFFVGITPALLVFFVRNAVAEPEVFNRARAKNAGVGFLEIFSPRHLKTTALCSMLAIGAQGGYYAINTWLPTFLRTERKLSVLNSGGYLAVVIAGAFSGYLTGAWLSDRLGRKAQFYLFAIGSGLIVLLYTQLKIDNGTMLLLGFPLGFFASGIFSGMGAFFTELFPTNVRGSGQGFSYNFGRGVGALSPWLIGRLSERVGLGVAIGLFAAGSYAIGFAACTFLPETKGRALQES